MKKTKLMMMGFAIFAAMLMLMPIGLTNVEASVDIDYTSTSATNFKPYECYGLYRLYLLYSGIANDVTQPTSTREYFRESMHDVLDEAKQLVF